MSLLNLVSAWTPPENVDILRSHTLPGLLSPQEDKYLLAHGKNHPPPSHKEMLHHQFFITVGLLLASTASLAAPSQHVRFVHIFAEELLIDTFSGQLTD